MREEKVIAEQTKSWQPYMNKLSVKTRKNRKRIMSKRIRQAKKCEISD